MDNNYDSVDFIAASLCPHCVTDSIGYEILLKCRNCHNFLFILQKEPDLHSQVCAIFVFYIEFFCHAQQNNQSNFMIK